MAPEGMEPTDIDLAVTPARWEKGVMEPALRNLLKVLYNKNPELRASYGPDSDNIIAKVYETRTNCKESSQLVGLLCYILTKFFCIHEFYQNQAIKVDE